MDWLVRGWMEAVFSVRCPANDEAQLNQMRVYQVVIDGDSSAGLVVYVRVNWQAEKAFVTLLDAKGYLQAGDLVVVD